MSEMIVVGCGIFGVTAALELRRRGHSVRVLDPGPLPHPDAASTDVSKVVRMEYGADRDYMEIVDSAITGWLGWNEEFETPLFHRTGATMFSRTPMAPGQFEYESFHHLLEKGHCPERLDSDEMTRRFPAWKPGAYVDGFFHQRAGYAESGRVVATLVARAERTGVRVEQGDSVAALERVGGRVRSVRMRSGARHEAERFVVAAGAWTQTLLPELHSKMRATGHPVFHIRPSSPELFTPPQFVVFTADIAATGWYGFPLHPTEGVVKIANHGVGTVLHPEHDERQVTASHHAELQEFLAATFPSLLEDPVVFTRLCLYNDTVDEHLWIDRHPELDNLTVSAGGSGHAFKMAPLLGSLTADAVERKPNRWLSKFRWRDFTADTRGGEEARYHGDGEGLAEEESQ